MSRIVTCRKHMQDLLLGFGGTLCVHVLEQLCNRMYCAIYTFSRKSGACDGLALPTVRMRMLPPAAALMGFKMHTTAMYERSTSGSGVATCCFAVDVQLVARVTWAAGKSSGYWYTKTASMFSRSSLTNFAWAKSTGQVCDWCTCYKPTYA